MSKFTFVELFAGIGGVSYGLERLGGECLLAAEFDPERRGKRQFAQEAYKILHPETPVTGDVYELKSEDVPKCDVLSFTTPCQSFSVAGKRGGFEDVRGTVFFEAMRIANDVKPKIILMENVKGIIGHDKGKTLDTIVKSANDVGYRVDFEVLNSKFFGVAQNRERFFMVGIREDIVPNEPWSEDSLKGATVVPKGKRRISGYEGVKTFNFDWPVQGEVTTRLRDILEPEVDEKYYLDEEKTAKLVAQLEKKDEDTIIKRDGHGYHEFNKVTPTLAANAGTGGNNMPFILDTKPKDAFRIYDEISPTLQANDFKEPKQVVEPQMLGHVDIKGHDAIKRVYSVEGVSPTPTTMGGGHRDPKIAEMKEVAGANNLAYCIDANYAKGIAPGDIGKGRRTHVEETTPRYRIRKLTPKECWRLQNFPDEAFDKVKASGMSDSQMYKQAGNAVTVSVVEAIGENLLPYLRGDSLE